MEMITSLMMFFVFLGVVAILWNICDICKELNNVGRQLESLDFNVVATQKNTDDIQHELDFMDKHTALLCEKTEALTQGYDALTQDIIHLMFGDPKNGDPRKEGEAE